MRMMSQVPPGGSMQPGYSQGMAPPVNGGFNFTYVREGEQQVPQQQQPMHHPGMNVPPHMYPGPGMPMGMMPPHMMGMYPAQGPVGVTSSAPIPVNRDKKNKENGSAVLVPAAFAVKGKK